MHLFNCIWEGLATGFVLSLMLGTVFFALIKNSIAFGPKTGVFIATGVIICDMLFISLALLSEPFAEFLSKYKKTVSVVGGSMLILMGIFMIFKANPKIKEGKAFGQGSNLYYIGNGFLLNAVNPINFFIWLGISSSLTIQFQYNMNDKIIFFASSLVSIFFAEIGIALFAARLGKWVSPKVLMRINQISGLVFIGVGLKLIFVS
ncbi:MAG: LysE family transporter [Bacteroidia bacterium]|nr:LysE family transporter [Bacteroidia bacterium]